MPDEGFVGSAARSGDGALCWSVEPADGASRLIPVPCALAKPVPAISATAATDIIKRLVMEYLLRVFALPAPTTKGDARCSAISAVPPILFCECAMNRFAAKIAQTKSPACQPALLLTNPPPPTRQTPPSTSPLPP